METLFDLFGPVCGQQIEHTWLPGGLGLPVCQRCTGLYVGAALATGLRFWFRPRLEGRFLLVHGVFLLGMAPFGFHWIAHGPAVRTVTGLLFGAGVAVFLSLWSTEVYRTLRASLPPRRRPATRTERTRVISAARFDGRAGARWYWVTLGMAGIGLPFLCQGGGGVTAFLLSAGIAAGGLSLVLLLTLDALAVAWFLGGLVVRSLRPAAA